MQVIAYREKRVNPVTLDLSQPAFRLRLEPPLEKPERPTTHAKTRPEKAFILFLNKSIRQLMNVTNYISTVS